MTTIRLRRDTAATWAADNPVLHLGEPGYATDTDTLKIGDGVTAWISLPGLGTSSAPVVNVTSPPYNATGNDTADDTAAILAAISAASSTGLGLYFPPSKTFKITAAITIPANVAVYGYGATLRQATASTDGIVISGSNVTINGLTVTGPGGTMSDSALAKAINIQGASSASTIDRPKIVDCTLSGFAYGVYARWATKVRVRRNTIGTMWDGGVLFLSVLRGWVTDNEIDGINSTGNCYGIAMSRWALGTDLTSDPRTSDVFITRNYVSNIPYWEGLDTHGGQRITFAENVVTNCYVGVQVGSSTNTTNTQTQYAPLDCNVVANILDSGKTDGTASYGVAFSGADDTDERGTGTIDANIIRGYGSENLPNSGAIYAHTTECLSVAANTIEVPSPIGISMYHDNRGFAVAGNTVVDPWTNSGAVCMAVACTSINNIGDVSGNALVRGTLTGKTHIGDEGIRITNASGNSISVGTNMSTMTLYLNDAGKKTYTQIGRAKYFASTASPESVITAAVGSVYTDINGTNGNVLYLKERNSTSTGWRSIRQNNRAAIADANYTILTTDTMVSYTSIAAARVVTTPTAASAAFMEFVVKDESGSCSLTNTITITPPSGTIDGAASLVLSVPYARVVIYSNGTNWFTRSGPNTPPDVQTFTADGTWTKPAGAKLALVEMVAGGGGGGSGARRAAGVLATGGGGGGGGAIINWTFDAANLPATVAVTVGQGGAGAAAIGADDTNGSAGTLGTSSIFASFVRAWPGAGGSGGTSTIAGAGGAGNLGTSLGGTGSSSSATGAGPQNPAVAAGAPGGAAGGGITTGNAASNGGSGQTTWAFPAGAVNGTGGVVDSTSPTAGGSVTTGYPLPGASGGGGAASVTTAAQAGAAPGNYGAGGAGGGASRNGNASGAGGAGANGIVRVVTYF